MEDKGYETLVQRYDDLWLVVRYQYVIVSSVAITNALL